MNPVLAMEEGYVCHGSTTILHVRALQVSPGEVILLNGPNGSGKTSLFLSIINSGAHFDGRLLYKGRDISGFPSNRRLDVGIVFIPQGRRTFSRLAAHEHAELSEYWLKRSLGSPGISLRRRGRELSGGEAKTLIIRCLMARQHDLLIMDEPFANLDRVRCQYLVEVIRSEAGRGVGCLLSDHTGLVVDRLESRQVSLKLVEDSGSGSLFTLEGQHG